MIRVVRPSTAVRPHKLQYPKSDLGRKEGEEGFSEPRARAVTGAYRFGLLFSQDSNDKLKRRPFRSILIKFDVCEKKRTVWTLAAPVGVRRGVRLVPTRASALGLCFLLPHTGGGGNTGPARSRASGQE